MVKDGVANHTPVRLIKYRMTLAVVIDVHHAVINQLLIVIKVAHLRLTRT